MTPHKPYRIGLIVGEESGDFLGSELMEALVGRCDRPIEFIGLGGERMCARGMTSLFDISDISVMGISAVLARLPLIVKRVYQTVDYIVEQQPDALVIIDSPDFTHNVAKRVRKRAPHIPIVGYVSPSVWAWRPGRAKKMSAYVDELLALLPFEPEVHARLGGPRTHYVGHPLIENLSELRPAAGERTSIETEEKVLVVLPGSRRGEIESLMDDFGQTVALLKAEFPKLRVLLPAVSRRRDLIEEKLSSWTVKPEILEGGEQKHAAFRSAHAALAASGTVSLELAIAGVPMAIAYKLDWFYRRLKQVNRFVKLAQVTSMVLPNIILGRNVIPEFLDEEANPTALASVVRELLVSSPEREAQVEALGELDHMMRLPDGKSQKEAAASVVLGVLKK